MAQFRRPSQAPRSLSCICWSHGLATYFCMICTDPECMQKVQPQQVMVILIVLLLFVLDTPLFRLPGGRPIALLRAGLHLKSACKAFSSATTSPTC